MPNDLLGASTLLWSGAALLALIGRPLALARAGLVLGCLLALLATLLSLPDGSEAVILPFRLADEGVAFRLEPAALWLLGFGLAPAIFACCLTSPSRNGRAGWLFGAAFSLLGAIGVFGIQNGGGLLVSWELMSLGGAAMLLSERLTEDTGGPVLFMLALLEVGAVALLLAVLLLTRGSGSLALGGFTEDAGTLTPITRSVVGVFLIGGFGAKLGLLPFYEWFPGAYGAGSGATGALMSGVVLNAAFFGLSRGILAWLPADGVSYGLGMFLVMLGVLSGVLAALYAFQQEDWRGLLSLSSAENASIAVTALGAAVLFHADHQPLLAGLAWTVSLLHLAGHALAKGAMFLTADGIYVATGSYVIRQSGMAKQTYWVFSVGALFAAMSLAAMPPQAGFVSEWFVFQTVFQGFHLSGLGGRLVLSLAGAGLALTVAVALATFVKAIGIGMLGAARPVTGKVPNASVVAVGFLGACVLALATSMPWALQALGGASITRFNANAPGVMKDGLLLVPLTKDFAFISPTMLVMAMPLLALLPVALLLLSRRHFRPRAAPTWYGGRDKGGERTATTALTFSNALRTFYSFIYRPALETKRETSVRDYFVTRLVFSHGVSPIFGPSLFAPTIRLVQAASDRLRLLQSGRLNFYLALIGGLLVLILALTLL